MRLMRAVIALDPRLFGRGRIFLTELVEIARPSARVADDLRLFATTFLSGFVAVIIYFA
jgi:hypothetical protein